ncbi:MAG: alpha/beta fold hydrolase [Nostocoides sp.]
MTPPRRAAWRRCRAAVLGVAVACLTLLGSTAYAAPPASAAPSPPISTTVVRVPVGPEQSGAAVTLDTTIYAPSGRPGTKHPAVILAHGFGGSKADLASQATELAGDGYVVIAYTARGFGGSGGQVHLDDPAYEIADARHLVDLLATRPDVELDAPNDPRVGVVGGSYGGALALMTAAADPRIDGIVSLITWNDLATAFFPNMADASLPGPFKQLWASRFFASTLSGRGGARPTAGANPLCGRFDPTVCRLFLAAAETGSPSPALLTLLHAHSPAPTLANLKAPTLLVQGMTDSLFGLDQADATATTLAAQGVPLAVRWTDGGHDAPSTTATADNDAARIWLDRYVRDKGTSGGLPVPAFTYALPLARFQTTAQLATLPAYPGLAGGRGGVASQTATTVPLSPVTGGDGRVLNPPGGQPASVTTVPGLGGLAASLPTYQLAALPGESTAFDTATFPRRLTVIGSPRVHLNVQSTGGTSTLFVSLWQVQGDSATQPRPLVAPVRVTATPGTITDTSVALPPGTYRMAAGSVWRVLVTTTDSSFANDREARADIVSLAGATLELPVATAEPVTTATARDTESIGVGAAIVALLLALGGTALWRRNRQAHVPVREDLAEVPLVVDNLVKTFKDGHRAVNDVSWRAERGQVVGLLGPNGAGKTTTMRMLLGLIRADSGTVHVLGQPVTAGSAVLGRVGALVEGPGFLPHLTGRDNLHAYWRATGRPDTEAGFEEALAVAALGGALDRPLRTYSHGMKQRLGIAQAMLGRPELLFLDEPTNGLDPPQIAAMRPILQSYAASGRTVVVSSHLLAEVEQTCSHVIVMHAGKVVTSGRVADLVDSTDTTVFELGDAPGHETAADRLRQAAGIRSVDLVDEESGRRLTVVADRPRAQVVRAAIDAGLDVVGVGSKRHLEEVFLGVIAAAQTGDAPAGNGSLIERLRQVRAR